MAQFDQARALELAAHLEMAPSAPAPAPPPARATRSPRSRKGKQKGITGEGRAEVLKVAQDKSEQARAAAKVAAEEAFKGLDETSTAEAGPSQTPEEKRLARLELQLARLEAEIASRKAAVLSAPSSARMLDDPPVLGELKARRLVELQIREHEKAARVDQELIEDGEAELALAKRMVEEAATMKRGLAARLAEVQAQKDLTPDDLVLDAKKKAKSIEHSLRLIQGQMVEFIDRLGEDGQAPDSDDEDEPKKDEPRGIRLYFQPSKKPKKSDLESEDKAHQLKTLLERLMNASVTSPADPWIDALSPATDPDDHDAPAGGLGAPEQLVHYLLRAGIAVEHPADKSRIKLVEFWRRIDRDQDV